MAEDLTGSEFLGGRQDDGINFPSPKYLSDVFLQPLTAPSIFDFYQARGFSSAGGEIIEQDDIRYRQEHEPYRFEPDGDMVVWITKAHLYELHPRSADNVIIHELNELSIKVDPTCVVWTSFVVDTHGKVIPNANGDTYVLGKTEGETVPSSINFVPEDEDGDDGSSGIYYIPLFWVKDRKIVRNYWDDTETPARGTFLYGGVQGHRGPMWWIKGYNNLQNIGSGEKVYKQYVTGPGQDFHQLRTIDDRAQALSSPFKGTPQVNVETNGDEIEIKGNAYNKEWNIGSYRVGLFEDGLAVCLKNLACTSLYTRELTPVSVATTSATSVVHDVTVETGSVGACSGHGTLTLQYHEVAAAGSSAGGSCYVLGVVGGGSSAPANASGITSIACATAVTNVTHADTSVLRSTGTVSVYQAHGSGNHKFLESTASDGSQDIKFVACPTANCDDSGADAGTTP